MKYKTFEEVISEIFENGNLKKGYRVILTNIRTSCVRCSKTTFEFILDYIEIESKNPTLKGQVLVTPIRGIQCLSPKRCQGNSTLLF